MKISLNLQDNHHDHHHKHHHSPPPQPLLLRAKLPITIFNLPFLSHFSTTTTHPSDLSLSLSTNFPSLPSLKLSYASAASAAVPPITLTLKSGTGLFGSPKNSPLVISAHFSFNPSNSNPNPTFSLLVKPQLGSFSLRKSTSSHPDREIGGSEPITPVSDSSSFAFVPLETPPAAEKQLRSERIEIRDSILKGAQVAAATRMPLGKRAALSLRWRVSFAEDQMPVLRINKIGVHRVDDDAIVVKSEKSEGQRGELEVLRSMCCWMKREVDDLARCNREMRSELEEVRRRRRSTGVSGNGNVKEEREGFKKKTMSPVNGNGNGKKEEKKNGNGSGKKEEKKNVGIDVESEFQKAIMAASAAAAASSSSV